MKAKKILGTAAVVLMSTLLLAACGGNDSSSSKSSSTASSRAVSSKKASSSTAKSSEAAATGDLKDGTYTLEEKNYSHGYRTVFSVVVKDGKIAESNYDNVSKDGKSKTKDADYEKQMKDKVGVGPVEYTEQLNKELVDKQAPDQVDTITGATESAKAFKDYAQQLIDAAKKGDTTKIEVDNKVSE